MEINGTWCDPNTGIIEETTFSGTDADIAQQMMEKALGSKLDVSKALVDQLTEYGVEDAGRLVAAFAGFAIERGWKSPETPSEFLSWLIWKLQKDVSDCKTTSRSFLLYRVSHDVAHTAQNIYILTNHMIEPAPYEVITKKNKQVDIPDTVA